MSAPRSVSFSLLFFKTLSGLGVGVVGMLVLIIFVLLALGTTSNGAIDGPFLVFAAILMGFITALITNCLGVFFFGMLDQAKYANVREVVRHIVLLNTMIFLFLLPVYFFVIIGTGGKLTVIFMIAVLQLFVSAQASLLTLELSTTKNTRENMLAVYGIIFSLLAAVIANLWLYKIGQDFSSPTELASGGSGGKGATVVLFSILPLIWLFFGIFSSAVEMIYRWIYETWGTDFLSR